MGACRAHGQNNRPALENIVAAQNHKALPHGLDLADYAQLFPCAQGQRLLFKQAEQLRALYGGETGIVFHLCRFI